MGSVLFQCQWGLGLAGPTLWEKRACQSPEHTQPITDRTPHCCVTFQTTSLYHSVGCVSGTGNSSHREKDVPGWRGTVISICHYHSQSHRAYSSKSGLSLYRTPLYPQDLQVDPLNISPVRYHSNCWRVGSSAKGGANERCPELCCLGCSVLPQAAT